jgi:hypothetical protein
MALCWIWRTWYVQDYHRHLPPMFLELYAIDSNEYIGMARIFTCAPGVAKLVTGKNWSETGLPECFELTKDRVAKMAVK